MAWLTQRIGSAAIFWGGGPEGRRWWAFVNLADRSPLFQQLRSHLKSLAPCAGSSWATGIQARPRAGTHTAATYCNPARRQRLRRTASTEVTLGAQNMSSTQPTVRTGGVLRASRVPAVRRCRRADGIHRRQTPRRRSPSAARWNCSSSACDQVRGSVRGALGIMTRWHDAQALMWMTSRAKQACASACQATPRRAISPGGDRREVAVRRPRTRRQPSRWSGP
jgi:hypothetical protein